MSGIKFAIAFLAAWMCLLSCVQAQQKVAVAVRPDSVYLHPDVPPKFKGDLLRFLVDHFDYPDTLEEGVGMPNRIYLSFTVGKDGYIKDVNVEKRRGSKYYDANAMKMLMYMNSGAPIWEPGYMKGEIVRADIICRYTFAPNNSS